MSSVYVNTNFKAAKVSSSPLNTALVPYYNPKVTTKNSNTRPFTMIAVYFLLSFASGNCQNDEIKSMEVIHITPSHLSEISSIPGEVSRSASIRLFNSLASKQKRIESFGFRLVTTEFINVLFIPF